MSDEGYAVILLYSTSHALRAEKILKNAGIPCKMIPVPRHLSSDCGVCVRFQRSSGERALRELEANGLEIQSVENV